MTRFIPKGLWYALVAVCLLSLFFIQFDNTTSAFFAELIDAGHIVVFFIVGWLAVSNLSGGLSRRIVVLGLITLIASLTIEITQDWVGRAFQWADVYRNYLGLALGIAARVFILATVKATQRYAIGAVFMLTLLIFIETYTLIQLSIGQAYFQFNKPVLADFNYQFEMANWQAKDATLEHTSSGLLVKTVENKRFAGAFFRDFPSNWSGYQSIHLDIQNLQSQPLAVTLKITDEQHELGTKHYDERYNGELILMPGENHVVVPLSSVQSAPKYRELDLQAVKRIELFLNQASDGDSVIVNKLYLSSKES